MNFFKKILLTSLFLFLPLLVDAKIEVMNISANQKFIIQNLIERNLSRLTISDESIEMYSWNNIQEFYNSIVDLPSVSIECYKDSDSQGNFICWYGNEERNHSDNEQESGFIFAELIILKIKPDFSGLASYEVDLLLGG